MHRPSGNGADVTGIQSNRCQTKQSVDSREGGTSGDDVFEITKADLPRNAVIYFVVGAVMSVIIWWLEERSKLSPVEVDAIFRRLTLPAILVERKPE